MTDILTLSNALEFGNMSLLLYIVYRIGSINQSLGSHQSRLKKVEDKIELVENKIHHILIKQ
jgi:hypothetical protein